MKRYEEMSQSIDKGMDDRKIFATYHSVDRYVDRYRNKISNDTVMWVIKNAIKDILTKYKDKPAQYVTHSISTGIGVVIDWRLDSMNERDRKNHAFIITLLPIKKSHSKKPSDIYLIVEKQILKWADVKYVEKYDEKRKFEENMVTLVNEDTFVVVFWEGEQYDDTIHHLIIVN